MAKKKPEDEKRSKPVIVRLNREEFDILEKRASSLGMNISSFLRLLIRHGRIDLEEVDK